MLSRKLSVSPLAAICFRIIMGYVSGLGPQNVFLQLSFFERLINTDNLLLISIRGKTRSKIRFFIFVYGNGHTAAIFISSLKKNCLIRSKFECAAVSEKHRFFYMALPSYVVCCIFGNTRLLSGMLQQTNVEVREQNCGTDLGIGIFQQQHTQL